MAGGWKLTLPHTIYLWVVCHSTLIECMRVRLGRHGVRVSGGPNMKFDNTPTTHQHVTNSHKSNVSWVLKRITFRNEINDHFCPLLAVSRELSVSCARTANVQNERPAFENWAVCAQVCHFIDICWSSTPYLTSTINSISISLFIESYSRSLYACTVCCVYMWLFQFQNQILFLLDEFIRSISQFIGSPHIGFVEIVSNIGEGNPKYRSWPVVCLSFSLTCSLIKYTEHKQQKAISSSSFFFFISVKTNIPNSYRCVYIMKSQPRNNYGWHGNNP